MANGKSKAKKKASLSPTRATKRDSRTAAPVDPYKIPPDYVWKDVVAHEQLLKKSWEQDWIGKLPSVSDVQKMKISLQDAEARPRSQPTQCTDYRKLFWTPGPLPIIRFVPEQYGYYRRQKYLQEHRLHPERIYTTPAPQIYSQIRHSVNPLLC